jgi:saccharopine dehydrogenase-like NADP-dependent oxidoreductase
MKVLLLGVGMQGKAALYDLVRSEAVSEVVAADREIEALRAHVRDMQYGDKVRCAYLDAAELESIDGLMKQGPAVAIDLLPVPFIGGVAAAAVRNGVHLVNTFYTIPEVRKLAGEARARSVTILPEFGLDPGIDLVLLGEAVRSFDRVGEVITYGAGFPAPEAAHNPLRYKVSWTFEGVLRSYLRAGRVIRDGQVIEVKEDEMFCPEHTHEVEVEGMGKLEAFPNGDALQFADLLGLDRSELRNLGRYTLRWPGHCVFWRTVAQLGLLADEPVTVDGVTVNKRRFLAAALEPLLQYGADEQDVVIVRIEVRGQKAGTDMRAVYQMIDKRDLATGHTAMSRTVGYTASIGAQMIGTGALAKRGLLSPVTDVPYAPFVDELARRGIRVTSEFITC